MTPNYTFINAVQDVRAGSSCADVAEKLLGHLTNSELLSLLDGDNPFWTGMAQLMKEGCYRKPLPMGAIPRLDIPGVCFTDGPRGIVMGEATAFPVPMARGATWDVELEEEIGDAIGLEGKVQGANFFGGVCINLPRHPAWGRCQETYGEDPVLLGEFGAALTRGVQRHIMACVKHYALNSMENARFQVDVEASDAALHEVYLPHFRRVVEEGVASVMSSYNSVNGEWAGQNKQLLTDILRTAWGFTGFIISDFIFGLRDPVLSVKNGLDIEAPFVQQRAAVLPHALENGELSLDDVKRSGRRILAKEIEFAAKAAPSVSEDVATVLNCAAHRKLAYEGAARSMVLLKNEKVDSGPVLPLNLNTIRRCAVVGRLADSPSTGDKGSSWVHCPKVITPYEGLKANIPNSEIVLDTSDDVANAVTAARDADVAIVIVGYDFSDEGEYLAPSFAKDPAVLKLLPADEGGEIMLKEMAKTIEQLAEHNIGGDRDSIRLRKRDVEIVKAVAAVNKTTVVCIISGGAVVIEEWRKEVPAVVMSWYSGAEGGHALADLLLGRRDFAGRLPISIPTTEEHLPLFNRPATTITYDQFWGQRLLDRLGVPAAFPLGYGLSYASFILSGLGVKLCNRPDGLDVTVTVSNTGTMASRHVVQVYGKIDAQDFPTRVLLGFLAVDLGPKDTRNILIRASTRPLQRWTKEGFLLAPGKVVIEASSYSGDPLSLTFPMTFAKDLLWSAG